VAILAAGMQRDPLLEVPERLLALFVASWASFLTAPRFFQSFGFLVFEHLLEMYLVEHNTFLFVLKIC
jgi:hypothetical protein